MTPLRHGIKSTGGAMHQDDVRSVSDRAQSPWGGPFRRVLEPMERVFEVLFGLIMVLTFTSSLGAAAGDRVQTRSMLVGALSCNLAWGLIDAAIYLMAQFHDRARKVRLLRELRESKDGASAQRIIADALPPLVAALLPSDQLEMLRQKLRQLPETTLPARLTGRDLLGAAGVCLLVFLSTFPVVIPFLIMVEPIPALRVSNAVAITMLFLCGYASGRHAGISPLASGVAMVVIGAVLAALASALGG
jgi:VIT1/CCC1 family predicted Fe2+/Mn2+ transporter